MTFPLILSLLVGSSSPAPMYFNHALLGNVVRVISARFHTRVALTAGAKAPITGDFSHLDLQESLDLAAHQAGLEVVPLGKAPADGFELRPPKDPDKATVLADAARRRAQLLRQRALLDSAANSAQAQPEHAE